jgi:hypothetical protein
MAWEGICGDQALAHSADGRLFVDRQQRVCETATGRVLRELDSEQRAFFGLFSADASRVLLWHSAADGQPRDPVRLYDARTGKKTGEIIPVDAAGYPVFSPDARLVAWAQRSNDVRLYDGGTGTLTRTLRSRRALPGAECDSFHLLFSPTGEHLIVTTYLHESLSRPQDEKWNTMPTRVFHIESGREVIRFYANPIKARQSGRISAAACSPDDRVLATAEDESGVVRLIELYSGQVRVELSGHRHGVRGLAFAPDGKTLASGGEDNVVLLWDVTGTRTGPPITRPGKQDLAAWWADLASEDARRAGAAIASLIRTPGQSVGFLQDRLRPDEPLTEKQLARLIADLDADELGTRQAAGAELTRLGVRAEAALRSALKAGPGAEGRRRIRALLEQIERGPPPETLRSLRAVEVLEHVGTPEARRCIEALAKGAAEGRLTRDAKAALTRLAKGRAAGK